MAEASKKIEFSGLILPGQVKEADRAKVCNECRRRYGILQPMAFMGYDYDTDPSTGREGVWEVWKCYSCHIEEAVPVESYAQLDLERPDTPINYSDKAEERFGHIVDESRGIVDYGDGSSGDDD